MSLMEMYLSSLSIRMNEVMKVLTVISTIFIPLTFLVGVYGMNFDYMPELRQRWAYPAVWALMIGVARHDGGLLPPEGLDRRRRRRRWRAGVGRGRPPGLKSPAAPALLVLGASGSLGTRRVRRRRAARPRARVLRASRRAEGADAFRADLREPASLEAAFRTADVAICAVGPFDYDPAPAIAFASRARCHWIDLGDRRRFIAAAEAAAREAPIAVVSGASVIPGLVEALGAPLARAPGAAALRAWWSLGSRKAVSGALLYALLRPLGRRDDTGEQRPGADHARGASPGLRSGSGAIRGRAAPRRARANARCRSRFASAWITARRPRRSARSRRSSAACPSRCCSVRRARSSRRRRGSSGSARARGALAVEALDFAGRALCAVEVAAPSGLDLAALPPVWAARALLAPERAARAAPSASTRSCRRRALCARWRTRAGS